MKSRIQRCYTKDCQNIFRKLHNLALLEDNQALKGRQITDGGKQRAAPGHGKLITPPPSRREGGGRGRERHVDGGYASLPPVCTLPPLFPVASPRAHLQGLIIL